MMSRRRRCGFTLAEIMVMIMVFAVFSTGLVAAISLSLGYWQKTNTRMLAEHNARTIMTTITSEFRQAVISLAPQIGYLQRGLPPTAILTPTQAAPIAPELEFTEPTATYDPMQTAASPAPFVETSPTNYRRVRYFVQNRQVIRQSFTFDLLANAEVPGQPTTVAQASPDGSVGLNVTWVAANTVDIRAVAQEGRFTYDFNTRMSVANQF